MVIPESTYLDPEIATAIDNLESAHPAFIARPVIVRSILAALAHHAYQHGRHAAINELVTSDQAAELLGRSRRRVQDIARDNDIGWSIGRDRLFRPDDIDLLRRIITERTPGRPRRVAE